MQLQPGGLFTDRGHMGGHGRMGPELAAERLRRCYPGRQSGNTFPAPGAGERHAAHHPQDFSISLVP